MYNDRLRAAERWLDEIYAYPNHGRYLYLGATSMLETLGFRWERREDRHVVREEDDER